MKSISDSLAGSSEAGPTQPVVVRTERRSLWWGAIRRFSHTRPAMLAFVVVLIAESVIMKPPLSWPSIPIA